MFFVPRSLLLVGAGAFGAFCVMNAQQTAGAPDGPGPCAFHVDADVLNVRSGPSERDPKVGALQHGEQVEALPTVVDGFRDLGGGRWAAQEFLLPAPGSACAP